MSDRIRSVVPANYGEWPNAETVEESSEDFIDRLTPGEAVAVAAGLVPATVGGVETFHACEHCSRTLKVGQVCACTSRSPYGYTR